MMILSYFKSKYITLVVQVVSVMKLSLNYEGANSIGLSYLMSNLSYVLKKKKPRKFLNSIFFSSVS